MRAGLRKPPSPTFGPAVNMMLTITHPQLQVSEIEDAAKYYSALKYTKRTRVVEATDIPRVTTNSFVYVFDESGAREPLGERIVEGADNFHRFEMRDPNVTFTAYVPVGSIARGAELVKAGGNPAIACETCHGEGLKGSIIGPPLAGRPVTYSFRQLAAFRNGTRDGVGAAFMKPVVANLSYRDMIDLSAYIGSLEP
jgi:cytochrome c553